MNRKALEKMLAAGQASIDRKAQEDAREVKRKARQDFLKEPIECFMCRKTVIRKTTVPVTGLGAACKSHPGVS